MKTLLTLRDSDFGIDAPFPEEHTNRSAARAVVFDADGNVGLMYSTKIHYHKLPGGGIEEGEDMATALAREVLEEIGCKVKNVRELGMIEEFRSGHTLHQLSYCFVAELDGEKGAPQLTESEIEEGFVPVWLKYAEAVAAMEEEATRTTHYEGRFMSMRDSTFLKAAQQ